MEFEFLKLKLSLKLAVNKCISTLRKTTLLESKSKQIDRELEREINKLEDVMREKKDVASTIFSKNEIKKSNISM
jgi:hypothetical protein